jgi:hypothetical protein
MTISSDSLTQTLEESLQSLLNNHMADQPFGVSCAVCNETLETSATIDSDFDLILTVEPCETCLKAAKTEQ